MRHARLRIAVVRHVTRAYEPVAAVPRNGRVFPMKRTLLLLVSAVGLSAIAGIAAPLPAHAAACARGVYRAGCAGPNGAVVVHKPAPTYYKPHSTVTCANGVYRAGCAGPNGAAVVRKY
jgi:hypothetical protein